MAARSSGGSRRFSSLSAFCWCAGPTGRLLSSLPRVSFHRSSGKMPSVDAPQSWGGRCTGQQKMRVGWKTSIFPACPFFFSEYAGNCIFKLKSNFELGFAHNRGRGGEPQLHVTRRSRICTIYQIPEGLLIGQTPEGCALLGWRGTVARSRIGPSMGAVSVVPWRRRLILNTLSPEWSRETRLRARDTNTR